MRIKQFIILMLLLLANMFLLAHSVLPHAHHDGIVCFSLKGTVCDSQCCNHSLETDDYCCEQHNGKSHHHQDNTENCDLKEVVIRQDNDYEEIIPCATCLSLLYNIYTLNDLFLVEPEYGKWLTYKPYIITYISPYVGTISDLRAPPATYFLA